MEQWDTLERKAFWCWDSGSLMCSENNCPNQAVTGDWGQVWVGVKRCPLLWCVFVCGWEWVSGHVSARELHLFNTEENGAGGVVRLTAPAFQSSLFQREPRGSGPCKLSTDILYKSHCLVSYFWHPLSVCLKKKKYQFGAFGSVCSLISKVFHYLLPKTHRGNLYPFY